MKTHNTGIVVAVAFALWATVLPAIPAGAAVFSWTGNAGSTDWFDTVPTTPPNHINNWGQIGNPPAFPGGGDSVTIAGTWSVDIFSAVAHAGDLTLGALASLDINNNATLIVGDDSAINGTLSVSDTAAAGSAVLKINGDIDLTGTGSVRFVGPYNNLILYTATTDVLTLGAGQVIETAAAADEGAIQTHLVNNGLVDADAGTITLHTRSKTNNALIRARNGGAMDINGITLTNTGATLTADPSSEINLNAATINGGTINGGGEVKLVSFATLNGVHLDNVTARIGNNETLTLADPTVNDSVIRLEDTLATGSSSLRLNGNIDLSGTGQVLFASAYGNLITYSATSDTLTLGANQVIKTDAPGDRGAIQTRLVNNGLVDADAGIITLHTQNKTNNTLIRARNSGAMDINGITITNTGATLTADASSEINLNGATINGGTINGGGEVKLVSFATLNGVHLDNVTARVGNNETLTLLNSAVNDGVIRLEDGSAAGLSALKLNGNIDLTGTGQVLFTSAYSNLITYTATTNTLTLGANQVIKTDAPGNQGAIQTTLINDGLVETDGGTITLHTQNKTNNTLIRAANSGTLEVNGITITNTGATLTVDATSEINLNGATINGGTINGGGEVNVVSFATLNGGRLDNVTARVGNNETLTIINATVNDGVIRLEDSSAAGSSMLRLNGSIDLSGTGQVLFASPYGNLITYTATTNTLTLGANQVIKTDAPGDGGTIRTQLVNNGLVETNGGTITLDTRNKTNNTLIRATNSGTLAVNGITVTNTGAALTVDATSEINLNAATINNGTINGGGEVNVVSFATLNGGRLDNVTARVGNNETLTIINATVNDGVIRLEDSLASGSSWLTLNGNINLTGSGQIRFASQYSNLINYTATTNVLTNGPDHSIVAPAGADGTVRTHLVNHGNVIADGTIDFMSGRTITNAADGTIAGSGTINLNGATLVGNGTVSPGSSPGTLKINGNVPFSASGELLIDIFDDTPATGYDLLDVSGIVDLGGTLRVHLLPGAWVQTGETFDILTATDINGDFASFIFPTYGGGLPAFSYSRTDQVVTLTALADVPEPATLSLLALGAVALLHRRRSAG